MYASLDYLFNALKLFERFIDCKYFLKTVMMYRCVILNTIVRSVLSLCVESRIDVKAIHKTFSKVDKL